MMLAWIVTGLWTALWLVIAAWAAKRRLDASRHAEGPPSGDGGP
jgi:hypothetical protein